MEFDRQIRSNENDLSMIQPQQHMKPSAIIAERKKGLSSINNVNTPATKRNKLGNVSNTPLHSLKKDSLNQKNLESSNKKCGKPQKKCTNVNVSKSLFTAPSLPVVDEIENAYPMTKQEYRQHHFTSELSDFYVQRFHAEIMAAPFDDGIDYSDLKMREEMTVEEYFADFI